MITEGYLVRHYQGRKGGRGPAIIDIAQDHLLARLSEAGIFELGVSLKGGTAIRKFRAGNAGRFSTDLDFAGMDDAAAELLIEIVQGVEVGPFAFSLEPLNGTQRMLLHIASDFGETEVPARLDLGRRGLWLSPERLPALPLPIHAQYDFPLPAIPTARIEEVIAEKLARYRRTSLARDLYDLAWLSHRSFDEPLVRRVTALKIWTDVVDDGLGEKPWEPEEILRPRKEAEFEPEAIGYLTTPVDIIRWIDDVRNRFAFIRDLDEQEGLLLRCSRAEEWEARKMIEALGEDVES